MAAVDAIPAERQIDAQWFTYEPKPGRGDYVALHIRAGNRGAERVIPPAGEAHAFERQCWARQINVYVSPTGRSVRVFVDGEEVKQEARNGRR